jgi:hypothetical protein
MAEARDRLKVSGRIGVAAWRYRARAVQSYCLILVPAMRYQTAFRAAFEHSPNVLPEPGAARALDDGTSKVPYLDRTLG